MLKKVEKFENQLKKWDKEQQQTNVKDRAQSSRSKTQKLKK